MMKNHDDDDDDDDESLHVVNLGVFTGLLPPDGEVVDNSIQQ
jgi:hypothetical protein